MEIEMDKFYKYRKKPLVIEASQIPVPFEVETIEGTMKGKAGDYLVRGIKGEQYPVDREIFEESYELVKE
jgi:hypothetical protein